MKNFSLSNILNFLGPQQSPKGMFVWKGEIPEPTVIQIHSQHNSLNVSIENELLGKDKSISGSWLNLNGGWAFDFAQVGTAPIPELQFLSLVDELIPKLKPQMSVKPKFKLTN